MTRHVCQTISRTFALQSFLCISISLLRPYTFFSRSHLVFILSLKMRVSSKELFSTSKNLFSSLVISIFRSTHYSQLQKKFKSPLFVSSVTSKLKFETLSSSQQRLKEHEHTTQQRACAHNATKSMRTQRNKEHAHTTQQRACAHNSTEIQRL